MAGQALWRLLDDVPLYTSVACRDHDVTMAVVTKLDGKYWVRIFTRAPVVLGKRHRADIEALVALLAKAGVPIESGWEIWHPST